VLLLLCDGVTARALATSSLQTAPRRLFIPASATTTTSSVSSSASAEIGSAEALATTPAHLPGESSMTITGGRAGAATAWILRSVQAPLRVVLGLAASIEVAAFPEAADAAGATPPLSVLRLLIYCQVYDTATRAVQASSILLLQILPQQLRPLLGESAAHALLLHIDDCGTSLAPPPGGRLQYSQP